MNKKRRPFVMKKIIAAIVLFAFAGVIAFYLKDYIDRQNPDYAIPKMTVTADSKEIPSVVSGYSWSFRFGDKVIKEETPIVELSLERAILLGGEKLDISFSQPVNSIKVRISDSYSYEMHDAEELVVPYESGGYIYEVYADFESGAVLYYFYVVIE